MRLGVSRQEMFQGDTGGSVMGTEADQGSYLRTIIVIVVIVYQEPFTKPIFLGLAFEGG